MVALVLVLEAGMPPEAVQLLHGGGEVGAALCAAPEVSVISFTGSPETGAAAGAGAGRERGDSHGEYLHVCTEVLGSRVFFEVVQRIDGYIGYGAAPSTPIRMAAQRGRRLITVLSRPPALREDRPAHDYSVAHLSALTLSPPTRPPPTPGTGTSGSACPGSPRTSRTTPSRPTRLC